MKHLKSVRLVGSLCLLSAPALVAQTTFNLYPSRVVAQPRGNVTGSATPLSIAPNAVVGRELSVPVALAIDSSSSPAVLYAADFNNNRVLAWRNPAAAGNGATADLVVGQQDLYSVSPQGPGRQFKTGLYLPNGVAVDGSGNLYVADAGNNRILRFPKPFNQPAGSLLPDFVIGQTSFDSSASQAVSATSLNLAASVRVGSITVSNQTGMVFDAAGNLWVADSGNHRVVRYPATALASGQASGPAADIVLGQSGLTTNLALPSSLRTSKVLTAVGTTGGVALLNIPSALTMDPAGRIYVADALARVLVFAPPFATGMSATRLMGINGSTTPVNETTIAGPTEGLAMFGNSPLVIDTYNSRILQFDSVEQWPAETSTALSPPAKYVTGQTDFLSTQANRGQRAPSEITLFWPFAAAATSTELYVADSYNNRILIFTAQGGNFAAGSRVLGQDGFGFNAPNLVEGKEAYLFLDFTSGNTPLEMGSAVVDTTSNPPALYIADTYNNRILGFRDARGVKAGSKADLVIGQGDGNDRFYRTQPNYGSTTSNLTSDSGLYHPTAVAVDSQGNLYVADYGNSRVVRFPAPFAQPDITAIMHADLVLGQQSFTTPKTTDASQRTMSGPHGLAFDVEGDLLVSDAVHNRVLLFQKPTGGDFSSGMLAAGVFGQPDFTTTTAGGDTNRFTAPRGIAVDTSDRLYVADSGSNQQTSSRVVIFSSANVPQTDPRSLTTLQYGATGSDRLSRPTSVFVSKRTGEIWVADAGHNRVLRYPEFLKMQTTGSFLAVAQVIASIPIAVTQDSFGNLVVCEGISRLSLYFPQASATNAANYFPVSIRPISPGQYVSLFSPDSSVQLAGGTEVFQTVPMPTTLLDTQVLVNGQAVPLHFVTAGQINFLSPMGLPTSGVADIQVVHPSTGQVAAATVAPLGGVAPGLFTSNQQGSGQVAALNEDNTINSATNPISRGKVIQLFGTGQGFVPNAPPDGAVPGGQAPAANSLQVFINALDASSGISYNGLAPSLIGTWQINVAVPMSVPPGSAIPIVIVANGVSSFDPSAPNTRTTIAVKQ